VAAWLLLKATAAKPDFIMLLDAAFCSAATPRQREALVHGGLVAVDRVQAADRHAVRVADERADIGLGDGLGHRGTRHQGQGGSGDGVTDSR
jgi:hypothetical protein